MARPRLTGGVARGRSLVAEVPGSARPTSSRVREALFSMVGHDLSGCEVLDAFGGSGLLGLEAWSRGADLVTIVDKDRSAVRAIRKNVRALSARVRVLPGDVRRLAASLGTFDAVLVDPPYAQQPGPILADLVWTVAPGGWLVLETDARVDAPEPPEPLVLERRRTYGGTALVLYRRPED